jgi:hypothetical protein
MASASPTTTSWENSRSESAAWLPILRHVRWNPRAAAQRSRAHCFRRSRRRRRRFHAEPNAGRAGETLPPASARFAGQSGRHPGECRQRQLRHAHRRPRGPGFLPRRGEALETAACTGAPGLHRRNRRRAGFRPHPESPPAARRRPRGKSFQRRRARHHDHRPGRKRSFRRSEAAPRHRAHRRYDQGLRHDSSTHGHHAGFRPHRCEHPGREAARHPHARD